jgi:ClpP class serine protease
MKRQRFSHVIEKVYHRPWFITPGGYKSVRQVVDARIARAEMPDLTDMAGCEREEMEIDENGIAHISVEGTMARGISALEAICGGYDYEWLEEDLEEVQKLGVKGVFIEFDTPGGAVEGCCECADMLQEIAKKTPIVAWSDGTCASAGYNLAVSCTKLYGSQSSTWGSIGTIIPWCDQSAAWEEDGMSWEPITNTEGVLKGAGMGPSLTAAQRASLQEYVQDAFDQFKGNVLRNRNVAPEAMRGQAFFAPRALANNIIDGIMTERAAYEKLLAMVK